MDYDQIYSKIEALSDNGKNTALEVRTILFEMLQGMIIPGEIKKVYCTEEELATDYDETGKGRGKRLGWARCNGLNGTIPHGGRVAIGHSDTFNVLGAMGGAATHTLTLAEIPPHSHGIYVNSGNGGSINSVEDAVSSGTVVNSLSSGGGKAHNIMQPYIVCLFIQRIEV